MKLIWHIHNFNHEDWIRDILGDLVTEEIMDIGFTRFEDDAIHVVSSVLTPLAGCDAYFREARTRCRRQMLFHCNDEWFKGGYAVYRHFDLVVRHFKTRLLASPGILTVPVGYANGTRHPAQLRPADQRTLMWFFAGAIKSSRIDMAAGMKPFGPHSLIDSTPGRSTETLGKLAYDDRMEDTVFAPCPMGNVVAETWRFYEAMELGCIPLLEDRLTLDYYTGLLGRHPVPSFPNWPAARRYAEALYANKPRLLAKQAEIGAWWRDKKAEVLASTRAFLQGPSQHAALEAFGRRTRNRWPPLHEVLRLAELMRHQSGRSLMRRLARPLKKS